MKQPMTRKGQECQQDMHQQGRNQQQCDQEGPKGDQGVPDLEFLPRQISSARGGNCIAPEDPLLPVRQSFRPILCALHWPGSPQEEPGRCSFVTFTSQQLWSEVAGEAALPRQRGCRPFHAYIIRFIPVAAAPRLNVLCWGMSKSSCANIHVCRYSFCHVSCPDLPLLKLLLPKGKAVLFYMFILTCACDA